jgi:hypothetical protein
MKRLLLIFLLLACTGCTPYPIAGLAFTVVDVAADYYEPTEEAKEGEE